MKPHPPLSGLQTWREAAAAGGLALAIVGLLFIRTDALTPAHPGFAAPADHHKYIHMAENPLFQFHIAPYAWRVGVPLAARILPFGTEVDFRLITLLCLWATGIAVYYLGRAAGFSPPLAVTGMLLYAGMGWTTKYLLFNFWLPDAAAILLVVLLIYCILTDRDVWFAILLLPGVAVKESVLFAAPLYLTLRERIGSRPRFGLRWLGLTAPALLLLVGLRIGIPAWNEDSSYLQALPAVLSPGDTDAARYNYWELLREIGAWRLQNPTPEMLLAYTVGTFGVPAVVLPLLAPRRNGPLLLAWAPFLLMVYAQVFLATDTQRLLVLGFPALLILALHGLAQMLRALRASPAAALLLPLAILALGLVDSTRFTVSSTLQAAVLGAYLLLLVLHQRLRGMREAA